MPLPTRETHPWLVEVKFNNFELWRPWAACKTFDAAMEVYDALSRKPQQQRPLRRRVRAV